MRPVRRPWTPADLLLLERFYPGSSTAALGRRLGRSPNALTKKALSLGFKKSSGGYLLDDLRAALGCTRIQIRTPLRCGWLRATVAIERYRGQSYQLTDQALFDFLTDYPWWWERFPCPQRGWLDSFLADASLRSSYQRRRARAQTVLSLEEPDHV